MRFVELMSLAAVNTRRSGRRGKLAVASIAIGACAVFLIGSIAQNGQNAMSEGLKRLGVSGLTVYKTEAGADGSSRMSVSDAAAISGLNGVVETMPVVTDFGNYRMCTSSGEAVLWGVGEGFDEVLSVTQLYGRVPSGAEVRAAARVAVVDDEMANACYRRENIVGKTISVNVSGAWETLTVIGVIESQKSGLDSLTGGRIPDFVYLPYTTLNELSGDNGISQVAVKCAASVSSEAVRETVLEHLVRWHQDGSGYAAENLSGYMDQVQEITGMVARTMSGIAFLSLIVAGFGVMSSMLSSVGERKGEIGVYMAVGAGKKTIIGLFLCESVILCVTGGAIGAIAGVGVIAAVRAFGLPLTVQPEIIILSELTTLTCGLIFGVWPAHQAASLDPIEALRERNY